MAPPHLSTPRYNDMEGGMRVNSDCTIRGVLVGLVAWTL